ncbi:MAG: TIGR04076 family protein [Candidatus Bathyarchaeota archaeon]|nr:TIGR04076 family protein [Candidatus Bathyarchaeota archaeon]MDH5746269.1 TIGR04076 family protein [Candidatus Bathyarchaeota archaeon]
MNGEEKYRLVITVKEIRGNCQVFKVGDRIVVESPKVAVEKTNSICIHAFGCVLSMIVPLSRGISFKQLGLATEEGEKGYIQCLDPGKPYTDGGTVLFEIERERI